MAKFFNPNMGMVVIALEPPRQQGKFLRADIQGDDRYGNIVAVGPPSEDIECLFPVGARVLIPPRGQRFELDGNAYTVVFHMDIPFSVEGEG